jgi:hypothetical protein
MSRTPQTFTALPLWRPMSVEASSAHTHRQQTTHTLFLLPSKMTSSALCTTSLAMRLSAEDFLAMAKKQLSSAIGKCSRSGRFQH